jgi:ubiquinol-cytochrome c reductase cytochrome b subunit
MRKRRRPVRGWIVERFGLEPLLELLKEHRIPASVASRKGWMYVFGSATLGAFLVQLFTGVSLVTRYIPAPAAAYDSLLALNAEPFGALTRGMHFYGASLMVFFVAVHAARVYLTGSYKYPREMQWVSGVFLLTLVMGLAYTGQLLRWDEGGVWGVKVAAYFAERVPLIGERLAVLVLGGDTVGGATLSRFYALHVVILPLLLGLFVAFHLYLVLHNGICEPPKAGEPVDKRTYKAKYKALKERGPRYVPHGMWREAVAVLVVVLLVVGLAVCYGPKGPGVRADPAAVEVNPQADWFLMWYYAVLFLKPRGLETFFMVWAPLLALLSLLAVPFVASQGERALSRRPWALPLVVTLFLVLGFLIVLGISSPWTPREHPPLGTAELQTSDARILRGAERFATLGCQSCHVVRDRGGGYGPELTKVAARLSPEDISHRILIGLRDMPPYRDIIEHDELRDIIAFLRFLGGPTHPRAEDPT